MIVRAAAYLRTDEPVSETVKQVPTSAHSPAITLRQQAHWRKLHTENFDTEKLNKWIERIPGCSTCRDNFRKILESSPPRFYDWFRWTWEIHNSVNAKIGKPLVEWDEACNQWNWNGTFPVPTKRNRHRKIVTAIGPNRIDRQRHCIASWIDAGFEVVAMQTQSELVLFQPLFSDMPINWVESNDVESFYNFKTQKIRNLVNVPSAMVLNSDCEMSGDYQLDETDSISEFFVRWNYADGVYNAREFQWGLDGVYLTDEAKAAVPKDFPFCIGQSMWDYALPCILQMAEIPFRINHGQWLLHVDHSQNWTDEYWWKGAHWMQDRYGINPMLFRETYRMDLEPGWRYDQQHGKWEKIK